MQLKLPPVEYEITWHRWFAWHPVITQSGIVVWFEHVDRRIVRKYSGYGCDIWTMKYYRLPSEA